LKVGGNMVLGKKLGKGRSAHARHSGSGRQRSIMPPACARRQWMARRLGFAFGFTVF